jgi:hypothetical protein
MECPGAHIGIKIGKIGIVCDRLISGPPPQPRADPFGERRFARTDVSSYNNKMLGHEHLALQR